MKWQPIETAPRDGKTIFVAIAIGIKVGSTENYTTDPWCVWHGTDDEYVRWPHRFLPTHWMPLPEPPK